MTNGEQRMTDGTLVCAVLTPPARGAVATIGVRGSGAINAVGRRFRPASGQPLESFSGGRVVFGRFRMAGGAEEELVIGLLGPERIEVHCHGGIAAATAVASALASEGCCTITAAEWISGEHTDSLAATALLVLGQARTERTAGVLLDQYRGALRTAICSINDLLHQGDAAAAKAGLERLLTRSDLGLHLVQPWRVVLAGRPNAGKSSLMNAIVGYERAIVFEQPGTTRDVLAAITALDGWPLELADTAGLRAAEGELEAEGIERAWGEIAHADAVVFVVDTTAAWDAELWVQIEGRASQRLVVHNKCDLRPPPNDGRPASVAVSAKTGEGIEALCGALVELLVPDSPAPGEAVPFTKEQAESLRDAAANLERGDLAAARAALEAIGRPRADYDAGSSQE
jgi:tRNA modification GTPase